MKKQTTEQEKIIQARMKAIGESFKKAKDSEKGDLVKEYLGLVQDLKKIRKLSFVEKQQVLLLERTYSVLKRGGYI